jgi:allophanate hydrolase
MGMRLEGPTLEHSAKGANIISDGTAPAPSRCPATALPIVLLADRQTTGGYPKIATVISADLPALGRMTPGAKIAFAAVDIETAESVGGNLPPISRLGLGGLCPRGAPRRSIPPSCWART